MTAAKKSHWLRTTLMVLLACALAGTALAGIRYISYPDKTFASASIQFAFEEAGDGLAPNRQAFHPEELAADEILDAAIAEAGLGDIVTAEQVRGCLIVRGEYPENLVEQVMSYDSLLDFSANRELSISEYHPTVYQVKLVNDFVPQLNQTQLMALLDAIISNYQTWFTGRYSYVVDAGPQAEDLETYDYQQQLTILSDSVLQQAAFAEELNQLLAGFEWNEMGFGDISLRLSALSGSEVPRVKSKVVMNALSKNAERLLIQYRYQIEYLNRQLTIQNKRISRLDVLIADYDKNGSIYLSTSGGALTKIDSNATDTYNQMIDSRREAVSLVAKLQSRKNDYQLRIADLEKAATASGEPSENDEGTGLRTVKESNENMSEALQPDQEILRLIEKRDAILEDFRTLLNAYNAQEISDQTITVFGRRYEAPSLLSTAFAKKALMTAGPLCAVGFIISLALLIRSRRREYAEDI